MNRETWLNALAERMAPRFAELGHPLPPFRVSIGFTSTGLGGKANGECWDKRTTPDERFTILISPAEATSQAIAAILNHELIHAAVGLAEGHKGAFATMMARTGMERPFTCSKPGPDFLAWIQPFVDELGDIPHSPLITREPERRQRVVQRKGGGVVPNDDQPAPGDAQGQGGTPDSSRPPKQGTRLRKAACGECGYTVRVTQRWLEVGPPGCPQHGPMVVDDGPA